MIRVEATENFNYKNFNLIRELDRCNDENENKKGTLYVGDTFIATEEIIDYLMGNNPCNRELIRIIEYVPEAQLKEEQKCKD